MAKKTFTKEEMDQLNQSPYISVPTTERITYSKKFKEEFSRLSQEGCPPRQIFEELGIDPNIVGQIRIDAVAHRVRQYEQRPEGFANLTTEPEARIEKPKTDTQKIKELEHQLKLLEQENRFLKKKRTIDRCFQN